MSRKIFILILFTSCTSIFAKEHIIDLDVECTVVNFTGIERPAIAVNGTIPAPTLHFQQGDQVTINVHNRLDKETAIHWHGMIIPWQMDGVLGITQQGIPPGETFSYQFTLHQSGTYWYHAHAGLQEQQGLYGALIIDPKDVPNYSYNQDHVVILSDWSNTRPKQILANLKKTGEYYEPDFPIQPSLQKFLHDYCAATKKERKNVLKNYVEMQNMRMSIYDLSDIAYDSYLLNGQPNSSPWTTVVKVGDKVRLRFIGASASTIYNVKIPDTTMQIIHIDGNDIQPYAPNSFSIAPGETYDVIVDITEDRPYIIYAESIDQAGAAYGALLTKPEQIANYKKVKKFPEPAPVTEAMMNNMMGRRHEDNTAQHSQHSQHSQQSREKNENNSDNKHKKHADHINGKHNNHSMPLEPSITGDRYIYNYTKDGFPNATFGTKYDDVKALVTTNDPNKPVDAVIPMELYGYMDRYIWFINGLPVYEAKPLPLEEGKRYRIIFTNTSMMNHPMHIHGHWFILRNGNHEYDPLLHTIDVAPGATVVADVDADASGQWFFHCHVLYHMDSGMARVFQYKSIKEVMNKTKTPQNEIRETSFHNRPIVRVDELKLLDDKLVKHPQAHAKGFYFANLLDFSADPFNDSQEITYKGLFGDDYNKIQIYMNDSELEKGKISNLDVDVFYWRLISQFWAVKVGSNYFYRPAAKPYWQIGFGLEGLMPYFIETDARVYLYSGSTKIDLEFSRDTQITDRFYITPGVRLIAATKTIEKAMIGANLNQLQCTIKPNYWITSGVNIYTKYEYQKYFNDYKKLHRLHDESSTDNTFSLGISVIF